MEEEGAAAEECPVAEVAGCPVAEVAECRAAAVEVGASLVAQG